MNRCLRGFADCDIKRIIQFLWGWFLAGGDDVVPSNVDNHVLQRIFVQEGDNLD